MIILDKDAPIPEDAYVLVNDKEDRRAYFKDDVESIQYINQQKESEDVINRIKRKSDSLIGKTPDIVETPNGYRFNSDEISQQRMARAIVIMDDIENWPWVMADNSIAKVTKSDLKYALRIAMQRFGNALIEINT